MTQSTMYAEKLNTFNKLIVEWAIDKGIIQKNRPLSQNAKTMEEIVEIHDAMNLFTYATTADQIDEANHDLKDAIGDVYVTLVILAYMQINAGKINAGTITFINTAVNSCIATVNMDLPYRFKPSPNTRREITSLTVDLMALTNECHFSILDDNWSLIEEFVDSLEILMTIATLAGLNFVDCVDQAYGVIAKRTGTMINGKFVKDDDS